MHFAMERERDWERQKAFWEASERTADRRAGLVAAMILNSVRGDTDAKVWSEIDFFPYLAKKDGEEAKPREMTTAATVDYLRRGFGLYVPTALRQRVGLPD